MKKREPLKLMPLDEFGKLVGKIAHVPKDAILEPKRRVKTKRKNAKATKTN